jgi:hypothetical protein
MHEVIGIAKKNAKNAAPTKLGVNAILITAFRRA